jgi:predicted CopG family antitoxin
MQSEDIKTEEQLPEIKEEQPTKEQPTTIQLPPDLKGELGTLKTDERESYASVIRRLIDGRQETKTTDEIVSIALPRKLYRMLLMWLPENMSNEVRKGVR